jgi:hypothetical protein
LNLTRDGGRGCPLPIAGRSLRPSGPALSRGCLFSGLLFIGAASLVLAPFIHRIMHTIHLEED